MDPARRPLAVAARKFFESTNSSIALQPKRRTDEVHRQHVNEIGPAGDRPASRTAESRSGAVEPKDQSRERDSPHMEAQGDQAPQRNGGNACGNVYARFGSPASELCGHGGESRSHENGEKDQTREAQRCERALSEDDAGSESGSR